MKNSISHSVIFTQEYLARLLGIPTNYVRDLPKILTDTPEHLKEIAHYALAWGIGDDGYRRDFILRASDLAKKNLKWIVSTREDELDEWLASPEAASNEFTAAYIAFSNMRMASDEMIY